MTALYLTDAARRLAAATPVTGVGVCHAISSVFVVVVPTPGRFVPARDVSAAPKPTVAATHVMVNAAARRNAPITGFHVNTAASNHKPRNDTSPMNRARKWTPRGDVVPRSVVSAR